MKYMSPNGNRASIMVSDLEVQVLCKEQFKEAIEWLVERDFAFTWHVEHLTPVVYCLRVEEIHWAHNLVEFAQILEKNDYSDEA